MSPSRRPLEGLTRRRAGRAAALAALVAVGVIGWSGFGPRGVPEPTPPPAATSHPTSPPSEPSADPTHGPTVALDSPEPTQTTDQPLVTIQPAPIPEGRIATRVVVPALGIDLAVTRQTTTYPACGVAMYLMELRQPGQGGVTYLYAHAQDGSFLPLLEASLVNDGARMLGMAVEVYTGDSLKFGYRIVEVRRHVTTLDGAFAWQGESVFLQTSEGPGASTPKLQVLAEHVSTEAADFDAAHPQPRPVTCR